MPSRQAAPLYRLADLIEPDRQVLLHGDEPSADAGAELITGVANVACTPESDLMRLSGRKVVVAPMVDQTLAAGLPRRLFAVGVESVKIIDPPATGWTIASAAKIGWTGERILAEMRARTRVVLQDGANDTASASADKLERAAQCLEPVDAQKARANANGLERRGLDSPHFTILGHDGDRFFIFNYAAGKIQTIRAGEFGSDHLLNKLAPGSWWTSSFPGRDGCDKKSASNWFIQSAYRRGIYDPRKSRGRGAWIDDGRIVFHFGDRLLVDGQEIGAHEIRSKFTYELGQTIEVPAAEPMSDADGAKIVAAAEKFRWVKPGSGLLLAGFVALAPICGALRWRPHCWLTGQAGCGKSTILKDFAKYLMGGVALFVQGNTTEAGIRQSLGSDAMPVLFDEGEQQSERDISRMQGVLSLARQASTESDAMIIKGTTTGDSMQFIVRSMFLLSSVSIGIKYQADHDRIAKLHLKPKRDQDQARKWPEIKAALFAINADKTLPIRLLHRSMRLLPITLKNIEVFVEVAAARLGSQREGDQYGTLLAGAFSLTSERLVTLPEAEAFIDRHDHDWRQFIDDNAGGDESEKALTAILGHRIRLQNGIELSASELILAAVGRPPKGIPIQPDAANRTLRLYGMRVEREKDEPVKSAFMLLEVGNKEISKMLADTPFQSGWEDQIKRFEGAEDYRRPDGEKRRVRFAGNNSPAIKLSLVPAVIDADTAAEPDPTPSEDSEPPTVDEDGNPI